MNIDIKCADILEWAASYKDEPFHAIFGDPSYGWKFMNRGWDSDIALKPETWMALAEHLHPGGFIFAFGGPKTYHRLAYALEDAGLRLFPPVVWLTSQGFPKSTRIDTQIDKAAGKLEERRFGNLKTRPDGSQRPNAGNWIAGMGYHGNPAHEEIDTIPATDLARIWQGHRYGLQALKPCVEMVAIAQKPYSGKPVDSIVSTGAGALWIEGARIKSPSAPDESLEGDNFQEWCQCD